MLLPFNSQNLQPSGTSSIHKEANSLSPEEYLELFIFDSSLIGGTTDYYTNTPTGGNTSAIRWRGNDYFPLPFELSNVDTRGDGTAPNRPTLSVTNINQFLLAAILSLGDLVGMKVTRTRTFFKFTDNGSEPNINMHMPLDEWIITKKVGQTKSGIQFEMSSPLDRPGLRLPRKQILKDKGFPGVSRLRVR